MMRTVFERLDKIEDPWKDFWRHPRSLDSAKGLCRMLGRRPDRRTGIATGGPKGVSRS